MPNPFSSKEGPPWHLHDRRDKFEWKEFPQLAWLGLCNLAYRTRLDLEEMGRLGNRRWYWRLRLALALNGLTATLSRPVFGTGSSEFPESISPADLTYGETPILTAWQLGQRLSITPQDRVVDLGAGLGLPLLVCHLGFGAPGIGVEAVPARLSRAKNLALSLNIEVISWREEDFLTQPLPEGTIYWISPTTLEESSWKALQDKMSDRPAGTRCISLSLPLPTQDWQTLDESDFRFSWGKTRVYVQIKL